MAQIDTEKVILTSTGERRQPHWRRIVLVVGVILLAFNMRASITAVGPLLNLVRSETGLNSALMGLLTTLPLLAFGLISPLAPRLARRWGLELMLLVSLLCLAAGILLRSVPGAGLLFLGTALLGSAISLSNVLLPGLIKRDFPRQIGLMTAIYSTLLSGSGALGDALSIPLAQSGGLGWRGSLAFWALPAFLTALLWLPLFLWRRKGSATAGQISPGQSGRRPLWRSGLAWQVTSFMGLQSLLFYACIAWFPSLFATHGISSVNGGWLLALLQLAGVAGSFVMPQLAGRMRDQRWLVAGAVLLALLAYAGLLSGIFDLVALWCILLGLSQGALLGLSLIFFILRTPDARVAAELSGMSQALGYLCAACGPLLIGWLHDLTQGWAIPLLVQLLLAALLLLIGLGAGRNAQVSVQ